MALARFFNRFDASAPDAMVSLLVSRADKLYNLGATILFSHIQRLFEFQRSDHMEPRLTSGAAKTPVWAGSSRPEPARNKPSLC